MEGGQHLGAEVEGVVQEAGDREDVEEVRGDEGGGVAGVLEGPEGEGQHGGEGGPLHGGAGRGQAAEEEVAEVGEEALAD